MLKPSTSAVRYLMAVMALVPYEEDTGLSRLSVVDHDHFAAGLVRLHDAVRFTDFVEAEDSDRLDVEPTSRGVRGDLLKGHVREWEARRAEYEAAKER